jgi:phosphatidylglycerophosphatase A
MKFYVAPPQKLGFWHPATLISTFGGVGLLRPAAGTWGSAAALPFGWYIASAFGPYVLLFCALLAFIAGVWAAGKLETASETKDPSSVVMDEVVGQWIVLSVTPLAVPWYFAAFLAFRLFDIWKPWPANLADRDIKGGLGVMADDVIAALYGALAIYLLTLVI